MKASIPLIDYLDEPAPLQESIHVAAAQEGSHSHSSGDAPAGRSKPNPGQHTCGPHAPR